jgi:hypothetical protein
MQSMARALSGGFLASLASFRSFVSVSRQDVGLAVQVRSAGRILAEVMQGLIAGSMLAAFGARLLRHYLRVWVRSHKMKNPVNQRSR